MPNSRTRLEFSTRDARLMTLIASECILFSFFLLSSSNGAPPRAVAVFFPSCNKRKLLQFFSGHLCVPVCGQCHLDASWSQTSRSEDSVLISPTASHIQESIRNEEQGDYTARFLLPPSLSLGPSLSLSSSNYSVFKP